MANTVIEPLKKKTAFRGATLETATGINPVTFQDVIASLRQGVPGITTPTGGVETFERGLETLRPGGTPKEFQEAIAESREETKRGIIAGRSAAEAAAARRGISGSTIEGFNVAQAEEAAGRAGRGFTTQLLLEGARERAGGRRAVGEALVGRAGQEFQADVGIQSLGAQLDQQNRALLANLTSDELASIRNLQEAGKDRELQLKLGELGIQATRDQISASKKIAEKQRTTDIATSVITGGAILPF
jgi:hypothetical protein